MANREFLQKAHVFEPARHKIAGQLVSEKLDGFRCWWDGGITRGKPCSEVPWSNTAKHDRFVVRPLATGLWSSYGNPIQAPGWWLDALPPISLDGELYAGRGQFQFVSSTVRKLIPDESWRRIKFHVFDSPSPAAVLQDGRVNNTHFKKEFVGFSGFVTGGLAYTPCESFQTTLKRLERQFGEFGVSDKVAVLVQQVPLPFSTADAQRTLDEFLSSICENGGEGVILRSPMAFWQPKRVHSILKMKPFLDSEGTVIGYTWGRKTDLGSKLLGKMGNLILKWRDRTFELSGFTDEERVMTCHGGRNQAFERGSIYAGEQCESGYWAEKFPLGTVVTFRYRELTDAGVPKEARYWRKPA